MTSRSPHPAAVLSAVPQRRTMPYGLPLAVAVLGALTLLRALYLAVYPFDLHPDEAQYWAWAQEPAFGYFSKPPVVAWLIAATTSVCGDGEACVRLAAPLLHFLAALAIFGAGRRLFDARTGFWAALAYATLPGVSFSSVVISTDVPLLLAWAVALYAYVRGLQDGAWRWWLLLGAAIGLGLLGKYAMIFFVLSAAVHLAVERLHGARPPLVRLLAALALGLAIYAPNLWWNAQNGFVSYEHTGDNVNLGGDLFRPDEFLEFFGAQFGVFGPILFAALLLILLRPRLWLAEPRLRLLGLFVVPILAIMLFQSFLSRANANWAAPAYVAGSLLVTAWALRNASAWRGRALAVSGSVVAHAALIAVLMAYLAATFGHAGALPANADPFKRLRGWHELGAAVAHVRADFMPGAPLLVDERKLMAGLLYYLPPRMVEAYKWRPTARIHDHFDLTRPFGPAAPDRLLYVTERTDVSEIAQRFARIELIAEIRTPIGAARERVVRLYEVEGFQGYSSAR